MSESDCKQFGEPNLDNETNNTFTKDFDLSAALQLWPCPQYRSEVVYLEQAQVIPTYTKYCHKFDHGHSLNRRHILCAADSVT